MCTMCHASGQWWGRLASGSPNPNPHPHLQVIADNGGDAMDGSTAEERAAHLSDQHPPCDARGDRLDAEQRGEAHPHAAHVAVAHKDA